MKPEPIIFIHGLYNFLFHLDVSQFLAPHPAHIPDLLGYGSNFNYPSSHITCPAQVEHIGSVMDCLGIERTHVVAHSVGGVVAVLFAERYPHKVLSLINVEGNFTLKDAFWSAKIARTGLAELERSLERYRRNPADWLAELEVDPSPEKATIAAKALRFQSAATLQLMAKSVLEITAAPEYQKKVRAVLRCGVPFHLICGERTRAHWDVPSFVLREAATVSVQPRVGHLMTLEEPLAFLELVSGVLDLHNGSAASQ